MANKTVFIGLLLIALGLYGAVHNAGKVNSDIEAFLKSTANQTQISTQTKPAEPVAPTAQGEQKLPKFSVTSMIPAFLGWAIALLGILAISFEGARKHLIHVSLLVAVLGIVGVFMGPGIRGALSGADIANPFALGVQVATLIICALYVALGIKSFIDARRG